MREEVQTTFASLAPGLTSIGHDARVDPATYHLVDQVTRNRVAWQPQLRAPTGIHTHVGGRCSDKVGLSEQTLQSVLGGKAIIVVGSAQLWPNGIMRIR